MKNVILFSIVSLFCLTAFCDEGWSEGAYFNGDPITEEPILLLSTDPLAYSSALAKGTPKSLVISVVDKDEPNITAIIFADESGKAAEGTIPWDYADEEYKDFPIDDTYVLTETITSDFDEKAFSRNVTILPEPMAVLALAFLGALFLRKRAKSLMAILAVLTLAAFNAKADDSIVSDVSVLQMWPFDRLVIINYSLASENEGPIFDVSFSGSFDDGETTFDLAEKGTILEEGSDGTVSGAGPHKTFWMPDETFYGDESENFKVKVTATEQAVPPIDGEFLVIDLSGGPDAQSFPITTLDAEPSGGWTDEHKTTKMVLKKIAPGTFNIGSPSGELGREDNEVQHEVVLTKAFYAGIFEVSQKQYELVTGTNPSLFQSDKHPVEKVSYEMLRGANKGANWPNDNKVDEDSFFGILRAKTRYKFDLPTEAMWEFACRAGETTALNDGSELIETKNDPNLMGLGRFWYNGGGDPETGEVLDAHQMVGWYTDNNWGLFDMHGNVSEWCLDWYQANLGADSVTDPAGPETATYRALRGGGCYSPASDCRSAARDFAKPNFGDYSGCGFRVFLAQ